MSMQLDHFGFSYQLPRTLHTLQHSCQICPLDQNSNVYFSASLNEAYWFELWSLHSPIILFELERQCWSSLG